jgi:hypothetical protein
VVGVGAPLCDTPPATAPHPTIKTNKPAPARNAIAVLLVFITTPTVGSQHDIRIKRPEPAMEFAMLAHIPGLMYRFVPFARQIFSVSNGPGCAIGIELDPN